MTKLKKSQQIRTLISCGELDDPQNVPDMLEQAGRLLDKACSHEICGTVLFQAEDGKFYVGTVEFVISLANPEFVKSELVDSGLCRCDNCGHIEPLEELNEVVDFDERVDEENIGTENEPDGECTKCGCLSYQLTKERVEQLMKEKK